MNGDTRIPDIETVGPIIGSTIREGYVDAPLSFWQTIFVMVRITVAILLSVFVLYNVYTNIDTCYPGKIPEYNNKITRIIFGDVSIQDGKETELSRELRENKSTSVKPDTKPKDKSNVSTNRVKSTPELSKKKEIVSLNDDDPKYCYIGNEDGNRSCVDIKDAYKCMSGEIFSSMEACTKPALGH